MRRRQHNTIGLGGPAPIDQPRSRTPHPLRRALIAVAVIALVVAWMRYDPLAPTDVATECPPSATSIPAARFGSADAEQFPDRTGLCVVRNVDTTRATIITRVRNDGPVGVELTGARLSNVPGVFDIQQVAVGPADAAGERRPTAIDGSAPVPGGATRRVAVTVSLPACAEVDRARVVTLSQLPLRATVLGLPRDVDVRLDPVLRLQAETCPA